jgi:hypothetical protein
MDPSPKPQKALPIVVYKQMHMAAKSDLDKAISWLCTLAFFWCCRSCEYSKTSGERKTKLLCTRNLKFRSSNKRVLDPKSENIFDAQYVSITFEFQKNDKRDETITHQKSGDKLLCPVLAAANIINRLRGYSIPEDRWDDTPICTFETSSSHYCIESDQILQMIRSSVDSVGEEALGFTSEDVGTHSNRSGGAMGMALAGTPTYMIMLIGRWSSDSFLKYIRKQVVELSHGVSRNMIQREDFFTVPDLGNRPLLTPRSRHRSRPETLAGFSPATTVIQNIEELSVS